MDDTLTEIQLIPELATSFIISTIMTRQTNILLVLIIICNVNARIGMSTNLPTRPNVVSVGAYCSFNSAIGKVAKIAIEAAVDDVNLSSNVLNGTKLNLSVQDTNPNHLLGIVEALDFMENDIVAILSPQYSALGQVISYIANELQVPLLSFSEAESTMSSLEFPFLVKTAQSDMFQMSAIAEIVDYYEWRDVTVIYVDDDYGRHGIAVLGDKLAEKRCRITLKAPISPKASKYEITNVLTKVEKVESSILILHTHGDWGLEVFEVAQAQGMMDAGYVWITTDWLSTVLDTNFPFLSKAYDGIQGVLTLRMHIPDSQSKREFISRWDSLTDGKSLNGSIGLNAYGIYMYDIVWLLAHAIDDFFYQGNRVEFSNYNKFAELSGRNLHVDYMPMFNQGNLLLQSILKANVTGITGMMRFTADGLLVHPSYEIINVIGNSLRKIGYWSNGSRLSVMPPEIEDSKSRTSNSSITSSSGQLYGVIWPGQTTVKPYGWTYPHSGKLLRIGVPVTYIYPEVLHKVEGTNTYAGFCIDVFNAARDLLPYNIQHEFIPVFDNHTYNSTTAQLRRVQAGNFDTLLGGIVITVERMRIVDFTQPYVESGLVVVAPVKKLKSSTWAFLRPFTPMMWFVIGSSCLFVGTVIWITERRSNDQFRGSTKRQLETILRFSFSTLVNAQRENIMSGLSQFLLIVWLFVVLILNSTYTATLSSILTVENLSPSIKGIDSLISSNLPIGYSKGSFIKSYLINERRIHPSRLVPLNSLQESEKALENGTIAAIISERVYMEIFISTRCHFSIVGNDFAKMSWGMPFQRDSPLAVDLSYAILKLSESGELQRIRDKWLKQIACNKRGAKEEVERPQLKSFSGLFFLCGLAGLLALLFYVIKVVRQFMKHYSNKSQSSGLSSGSSAFRSFVSFVVREKEEAANRKGVSSARLNESNPM
ncbi:hypothetical protein RIF29_36704 [Crotalaria pallida]|uniref:Glutamate receptor n=1 Tax=Crotalaria pallida TaxID=3830 RepID=A0AAN9HUR9_CROPI